MTDDVKRYSSAAVAIATCGSPLLPTKDGPWVKYSDYAALQARVAELEAAMEHDKDVYYKSAEVLNNQYNIWKRRAEAAEALLSEFAKQKLASELDYPMDADWHGAMEMVIRKARAHLKEGRNEE